jgi:hypothetical protein
MPAHLLAKDFGHIKRRRIELQRMGEGFGPAHVAGVSRAFAIDFRRLRQLERALPAFFQPFRTLGLRFQERAKASTSPISAASAGAKSGFSSS